MADRSNRITIGLTEKTDHALADAIRISRDNKTDSINKAIQVYALLLKTQEDGGAVYIRSHDGSETERLRMV